MLPDRQPRWQMVGELRSIREPLFYKRSYSNVFCTSLHNESELRLSAREVYSTPERDTLGFQMRLLLSQKAKRLIGPGAVHVRSAG